MVTEVVQAPATASTETTELAQLIDHRDSVQTHETVERVYDWFQQHQQEYIAVVRGNEYLGMVSRGQIGFLLGARFGYAIFGRQAIGSNLMTAPLHLTHSTTLLTALEAALSRSGDRFYDDVAVVGEAGEYLGIITVPTLVQWQSRLILEKTRLAEEQQQALAENNRQLFRSLNELRQSRGRFEILFDNSALGVALLNPRGEIETCNRRLEALLGFKTDATTSATHDLTGCLLPKERETFLSLLQEHEQNPNVTATRNSEFMFQLRGNGPRLFKVFSSWVRETGQVCILLNDITEQRVLEHRLIQKEKSALLDSLVGGIAHEINNKLAPIIGYADLLLSQISKLKEGEKLAPYCETIRDAALESAKIIRQLLQLSRPLMRELAVVDLRDLFTEVQALLRFRLRESGALVETLFPTTPVLVCVDASQIKQVMINLVFNALDAMDKLPDKRLRLIIKTGNGNVVFRVSDNGHGIKPEDMGRIFNPFFTTKSSDRGSGLGLSVCLNIARNHSGDITVDSAPSAGAEFSVILPQATSEQIQKFSNSRQTNLQPLRAFEMPATENRVRILVADDEEFVTGMVQEALRQSLPCLVERAESGLRAVTRLQQADFDLIISDVRMPGMDGFGLYEWILKHQPHLARRFFFITGDAGSTSMQEKLESMSVPVLYKPFEIDALLHQCRELIKR